MLDLLRRAWERYRALAHVATMDDDGWCGDCGKWVAPHQGIRDRGEVFCSQECAFADWSKGW